MIQSEGKVLTNIRNTVAEQMNDVIIEEEFVILQTKLKNHLDLSEKIASKALLLYN